MCAGLALFREMTETRVYFPNPRARILCRTEKGEEIEAIWGRRNQREFPDSRLPVTGWARQESVEAGKWKRYEPEPVHIPATAYMEKDTDRVSHWFELENNQFLVGMLLGWRDLRFIYVVTVPTPEEFRHIHHRWVLIRELTDLAKNTGGRQERRLF